MWSFFEKSPKLIIILPLLVFATFLLYNHIGTDQETRNSMRLHMLRDESSSWVKPYKPHVKTKFTILFWTGQLGVDATKAYYKPECESEFQLTSNRSLLESADVIIFFYVDISREKVQLPRTRKPHVPWGLAFHEASINYGLLDNTIYNGLFNFTWTFRTDSEVHPVFDKMVNKYKSFDDKWIAGSRFGMEFLQNKTRMTAWVVSNCQIEPSRRNELVNTLRAHGIKVDVYGSCGNESCARNNTCFQKLGQQYKFYMSLENSLCVDYVTEKIYHGLFNNMIPIVYALGNIKNYAPEGSFIDVMQFDTIESLAKYVKFLDSNPKEYLKYFEWRSVYNISNIYNSQKFSCYNWRVMRQYASGEILRQRTSYSELETWHKHYYNKNLSRYCKNCLLKDDVSVTAPSLNYRKIYGNFTSMCE